MKKFYTLLSLSILMACQTLPNSAKIDSAIKTTIDLVNVENDQVKVEIEFPIIKQSVVEFCFPKTVPGTYSNDNYGRFIEDFKAWDNQGQLLEAKKLDDNKWKIANANRLKKVSYKVNDTYDFENEGGVFSPTGTNIEKDKNYLLNLHGFVGYLPAMQDLPYQLSIKRPNHMYPGTSLSFTSNKNNSSFSTDTYQAERYFEVTDNPIMYSKPDAISFKTGGMEISLSLYSTSGKYKASDFKDAMERTMIAQKNFLGKIDNTHRYTILLYLADDKKPDARGAGALEHHTSTVVVFPESMKKEALEKSLIDVVSHEFFHILTPLNVHSKEIHYFDYNQPKMSKHLWMYEGVTEYFANLFQIKENMISEQEFFDRMSDKLNVSKAYDDTMPFTQMSENILSPEYEDSFYNVYQKGALIGMCIDLQLRELSNGKRGILDLMQDLSSKYGKHKPFDDDQLINEIVTMTYPEMGSFFSNYVTGPKVLPYQMTLKKVGLSLDETQIETGYFLKGSVPYVDLNSDGEVYFRNRIALNSFLTEMGVKNGDILKEINGVKLSKENFRSTILASKNWTNGSDITFQIQRHGKILTLKGKTISPIERHWVIKDNQPAAGTKEYNLRKSWLRK